MTVFGTNVPRRKRTALVAPPGGMEGDDEPAAKNGDVSSGVSVPAADGDEAEAVAAAQLKPEQEERICKGKMLADDHSLPIPLKDDAPVQPPVAKLMVDDAIRAQSAVNTRAPEAVLGKAKKKRKRLGHVFPGRDGQPTSSAGSSGTAVSLDKIDVVGDGLRHALWELGVSPVRIYGKRLSKSDMVMNQHRLLMSCKSWEARHGAPFPLDAVLAAAERPLVRVQAYDRGGACFEVELKKLTSNNAYRIIFGWGGFLARNGLVAEQHVGPDEVELAVVELWAFRSPKLELGVHSQPDGPLGLVIVHYRPGESPHADAAIAEVLAAGGRAAMPRGVADVRDDAVLAHVHEDVVPDAVHVHEEDGVVGLGGDAVQVHEYPEPVLEDAHEDAMPVLELEDAVDDDGTDEATLEAAKAMLMLRYSFSSKRKSRRKARR